MVAARRGPDLFEHNRDQVLAATGPLAARMRPTNLDQVVGQDHLVGPGAPLRVLAESGRLSSCILWGPPGSGKTTIARLLADASGGASERISATEAGVGDLRAVISAAQRRLGEAGQPTFLLVDEVHRFSRSQQDVLLPAVEDGVLRMIGVTTENPFFSIVGALLSRSTLFRLEPLQAGDLEALLRRALEAEGASAEPGALETLAGLAGGDGRAGLGGLEVALALAGARAGAVVVRVADVEAARADQSLRGGDDAHFDLASALIKSIRGSDPDAGLYWLARMLEAGEDPRFLARRLVILASEDVGMADPQALLVATAAATAVEQVGLPEAALNLAQATVHLACAPKSNRVTTALGAARADLVLGPLAVPAHLRDAHWRSAAAVGHGVDYRYPHDYPGAVIGQQYRPQEVARHRYYEPGDQGEEELLSQRLKDLRATLDSERAGPEQ